MPARTQISAQVIILVRVTCRMCVVSAHWDLKRFPVPGIIRYICKNTPKHTMHGIHLCIAVRLELIVLEMLLSLLIHLSIRAVAQHEKCHRNQKASDDRGHRK